MFLDFVASIIRVSDPKNGFQYKADGFSDQISKNNFYQNHKYAVDILNIRSFKCFDYGVNKKNNL